MKINMSRTGKEVYLYLFYLATALTVNSGSLFRGYWVLPTVVFTTLISFLLPLQFKDDKKVFNALLAFGNALIAVLLVLLAFVLVTGKEVISSYAKNASNSVAMLAFFIFATYFLALVGKNMKDFSLREEVGRLAFLSFLLSFLILISFITSLVA